MSDENYLHILDDRYEALRAIEWWNQDKIAQSTVLVIGAGAIGNEVIKNLALIGVGRLIIVDFDNVETSNLSRSVLFRQDDSGKAKAQCAAEAVHELNPDVDVLYGIGDVKTLVGLGLYRHVSAIAVCVDNLEARLHINRACWKVGQAWIDAGMDAISGEVRTFKSGHGACFECTMTRADYQIIMRRYSCLAFQHDQVFAGQIPTTPTIAALVAGFQSQELLKILCDLPSNFGNALRIETLVNQVYSFRVRPRDDCPSHLTISDIQSLDTINTRSSTLIDLLQLIRKYMGEGAWIELDYDLVSGFECSEHGSTKDVLAPIFNLKEKERLCPICQRPRRPIVDYLINGTEWFSEKTLAEIGIPLLHIIKCRTATKTCYYELSGDLSYIFSHSGIERLI